MEGIFLDFKECSNCHDLLPATEEYFYKQLTKTKTKGNYHKFSSWCRVCTKEKARLWGKNNPEKRKEILDRYNKKPHRKEMIAVSASERRENGKYREWQRDNPDKIQMYNFKRMHKKHDISTEEKISCKQYFNFECSYCGMSEVDAKEKYNKQLHMDHVDPNGVNDLSNNVPACTGCNSSKGDNELLDWYTSSKSYYSQHRLEKIIKWINQDYQFFIKMR